MDNGSAREVSFTVLVLAIVVAWVLVAVWTRVFDNIAYSALGLDERSAWHAALVAIGVTIFFFAFIALLDSYDIAGDIGSGVRQIFGGSSQWDVEQEP